MPTRLHRYYGAGYSHFITTSCYRRLPLLGSARNRDLFLGAGPSYFGIEYTTGCPTLRDFRRVGTMLLGVPVLDFDDAIAVRRFRRRYATSRILSSAFLGSFTTTGPGLTVGVVAIAAPPPLLRFEHQAALDRVVVHVAKLFDSLVLGEDDEVIEASLPDVSAFQR